MTGKEVSSSKYPASATGIHEIEQLARTYQYDRYLTALLLPRSHREALVVLAAFAGELQRIPLITTEPMMAAIRLQWWRDELSRVTVAPASRADKQPRGATGHFLLDAIATITRTHVLPPGLLLGMIDAAERELDPTPFQDEDEMRQVWLKFDGAQFELAGHVLATSAENRGPIRALWPRELLSSAAIAYGAARMAAELRIHDAPGAAPHVRHDPAAAPANAEVAGTTAALADMAANGLAAARPRIAALSRIERGAFLPLATVQPLLRAIAMRLQQNNAREEPLSNFARAWALLSAHWRGRV